MPPGGIIGPNIVSTGLRFKTPKDSALPLPSMLRLFEHIIAAVASGPLGTGSTIQQPGRDASDFPLNPLISSTCATADGDLMGVLEGLHHCHPVRVWQADLFFNLSLKLLFEGGQSCPFLNKSSITGSLTKHNFFKFAKLPSSSSCLSIYAFI